MMESGYGYGWREKERSMKTWQSFSPNKEQKEVCAQRIRRVEAELRVRDEN